MAEISVKVNLPSKERKKEKGKEEKEKEIKARNKGGFERFILLSLVFLLPIFFLPFATNNFLDFAKQILLEVFVFGTLFLFFLRKIKSGRLEFSFHRFFIPLFALLFIWGISTIFAIWPYGSFWGIGLDLGNSFLSSLLFVLFFFLVFNIFEEKDIRKSFFLLLTSILLVVIISIFYIFGKAIIPLSFIARRDFTLVGTISSLAILVSALFPFLIVFLNRERKKIFRVYFSLMGIIFLFYLFLVNVRISWLVLMTGMVLSFSLELMNPKKVDVFRLSFPTILLALSLFFVVFRFSLPLLPSAPLEYTITQRVGAHIAKEELKESFLLGSGPGNFNYSFSHFKPDILNRTNFWNVRFRPSSEFLSILTTTGILGFLAFLFLIFYFLKIAIANIRYIPYLTWPIFSAFVSLLVAFLFYPSNFVLNFFFWLLVASGVSIDKIRRI